MMMIHAPPTAARVSCMLHPRAKLPSQFPNKATASETKRAKAEKGHQGHRELRTPKGSRCAMSANRPGSHRRRGGQRAVTGQYNGQRVVGLRTTGKLRVVAGPQRPSALQPAGRHPFTAVHRYRPTLALLGMEMDRALLTGGIISHIHPWHTGPPDPCYGGRPTQDGGNWRARPAMRATCDARHAPLCAAIMAAVPGSWEPSSLVDALEEALACDGPFSDFSRLPLLHGFRFEKASAIEPGLISSQPSAYPVHAHARPTLYPKFHLTAAYGHDAMAHQRASANPVRSTVTTTSTTRYHLHHALDLTVFGARNHHRQHPVPDFNDRRTQYPRCFNAHREYHHGPARTSPPHISFRFRSPVHHGPPVGHSLTEIDGTLTYWPYAARLAFRPRDGPRCMSWVPCAQEPDDLISSKPYWLHLAVVQPQASASIWLSGPAPFRRHSSCPATPLSISSPTAHFPAV
ncbi:hypothetical protein BKA56DRAFT_612561 [Ilyonectria sp. MPI-CAGE-AT-0026]|nr:hypothetical protein BKA56DRAFT_612561 [Ilyonectria sp. MPI-CAGE-AT-0026]